MRYIFVDNQVKNAFQYIKTEFYKHYTVEITLTNDEVIVKLFDKNHNLYSKGTVNSIEDIPELVSILQSTNGKAA